ncbi:capsular polysaccharide export protein, LipB/KpsS family [Mixta calida]|uniref:capsular polysaccharide export protein, LipB/KpsS family n=1 Tax=Mixta calida TaxID=665913 RepID=UPI000535AB6B|nr:hypothetical protein [Mixta calida]AIX73216.1 hypothetical protein PSNIH2_05140 [Pantoea sp. PSNIH2]MDU5770432.1 hypothetical protein [Mixta calida]POU40035.1 hypothetical protein C3380_23770 [Pantoea sp. PSNIH5]POU58943.1 hypothetical protein C3374_23325 [Pantoea sp. PSNIH4]
MKFIFLLHDDLRVKLFAQIAKKAQEKGATVEFLCYSIASKKGIALYGFEKECSLICDNSNFENIISDEELAKSIDVIAAFLSLESARKIASATYANICNIVNKKPEEIYIFGGNGLHVFDKVAKYFSNKERNVYTVFTELANIEGKTFFDAEGSNASSLFYQLLKNKKINFDNSKNLEGFYKWRKQYCDMKLQNHNVQQAKPYSHKNNFIHRVYGLIELLTRVCSYQKYKIVDLINNKNERVKKSYGNGWEQWLDNNVNISNYNFFPLQVFSDSQIKLHSKVNVEDALLHAIEISKQERKRLVVKPHPAEFESHVIEKIVRLKKQHGFLLSNSNTFELIKNADKVIVINSTVGLESILLGKNVEFLGQSFYSDLKNERGMDFYINEWLIDVDIFNTLPLTDEQYLKIMTIAKMKQH